MAGARVRAMAWGVAALAGLVPCSIVGFVAIDLDGASDNVELAYFLGVVAGLAALGQVADRYTAARGISNSTWVSYKPPTLNDVASNTGIAFPLLCVFVYVPCGLLVGGVVWLWPIFAADVITGGF